MSIRGTRKSRRFFRITLIFIAFLLTTLCIGHYLYRHSSHRGYDHYVGWYHKPDLDRKTRQPILNDPRSPGRLIPIFKRGDTFYTIEHCAECPLKMADETLVWDVSPSSLAGTTIGYNRDTGRYYLRWYDTGTESGVESYVPGEVYPLIQTDPPDWVGDSPAPAPKTLDDFLGDYYYAWCPIIRMTIAKNGERYVADGAMRSESGEWETDSHADLPELQPMNDSFGLTWNTHKKIIHIVYNSALLRYEMVFHQDKVLPHSISIPLLRRDPLRTRTGEAIRTTNLNIGIPAWH
ncbi:MAG: hypothetical protein ACYC26_10860 [Phycisphaerales bacterium]